MQRAILLTALTFLLFSCSEKKQAINSDVLIDADVAFSDYSVKHGYQKAFIEFAGDSVVLLKPKRMPILGKQNLIKSYEGKNDSGLVLSWRPAQAIIAESGELGFTYGFWTFVAANDTSRGTYLIAHENRSSPPCPMPHAYCPGIFSQT